MQKQKFFLVWTPNGSCPNKRHLTIEDAKAEANRLAVSNTGKEFYVLETRKSYAMLPPPPSLVDCDFE